MLKQLTSSLHDAIEEAKRSSKKRNFLQSVEVTINVKGVDLNKPENRFTELVELPKGLGSKRMKVCVIAGPKLATEAKKLHLVDKVLEKDEVEALVGNKREAKKLAGQYDYFLVDSSMIGTAARALGAALGARGKSPVPVPPTQDLRQMVERYVRSVTLRMRKSPQVSCKVGTEDMDTDDLVENSEAVISRVADKLEKRFRNIQSIYVKLTMGEPIKVRIGA